MPEILIHERENNADTESFLMEKRNELQHDAKFLLYLLYQGRRLNGKQVEQWGINSRRLRELIVSHKEMKREWKRDENGKRIVMEYWLDIPRPATKTQLTQAKLQFK